MKVVIQCAGKKRDEAGRLSDEEGTSVSFVAHPELYNYTADAPRQCRPDDEAGSGVGTWRDVLNRYNERYNREGSNPDHLLAASDLYRDRTYRDLVDALGSDSVYILSAGWGLVRAGFLLPYYDITFSPKAEPCVRRDWRKEGWRDFNHLTGADIRPDEPIHFLGGLDYQPLYYRLTNDLPGRKVIHHKKSKKKSVPHMPGYEYEAYMGRRSTCWYYSVAKEFIRSYTGEAA